MESIKRTPVFKEGDIVTYKDFNSYSINKYFHGGINQKGFKGTIIGYKGYRPATNCYDIEVTIKDSSGSYTMLESEFEEYVDPHTRDLQKIREFLEND